MDIKKLGLEIGLLKQRIINIENLLKDFPDILGLVKNIETGLLANVFNIPKTEELIPVCKKCKLDNEVERVEPFVFYCKTCNSIITNFNVKIIKKKEKCQRPS